MTIKELLRVIFVVCVITNLRAVTYDEPILIRAMAPFSALNGDAWGSFIGNQPAAPMSWNVIINQLQNQIKSKASPTNSKCFIAYIDSPPQFEFGGAITIPIANVSTTNVPTGYYIYQDFVDAITQHEYWHKSIHQCYANGAWALLESWLSGYESSAFETSDAAINAGKSDLNNALSVIQNTQRSYLNAALTDHPGTTLRSDITFNGPDANHSKSYVKCNDPDWGTPAYNAVQAIVTTFASPISGNCKTCPIPQ
jgi:hypothetical protein